MSIQIIKAKPGKLNTQDFIVNLLLEQTDEALKQHLEKLFLDDRSYLFVAFEGQTMIGYALAYSFPSLYAVESLAYLYDIEVLQKHRNKGGGKLLMQNMLEHLKCEGIAELWLGTATDNKEGQALFTSTGGMRSGETFNDFTWEF